MLIRIGFCETCVDEAQMIRIRSEARREWRGGAGGAERRTREKLGNGD
jgi:hypothetical protein